MKADERLPDEIESILREAPKSVSVMPKAKSKEDWRYLGHGEKAE